MYLLKHSAVCLPLTKPYLPVINLFQKFTFLLPQAAIKPECEFFMKNNILLSVSLFLSMGCYAQTVTFGAGTGVSVSGMRGDAIKNMQQLLNFTNGIVVTKTVAGFYAGGFANIPVGNNFSIEPGLYYSTKGYELSGTYAVKGIGLLSAQASTRLRSNYIDMPVLFKADIDGFQVFAGPQLSYLTNANLITRAGILGFNLLNNKMDVTRQLNRWDAAVTAGAGYKFSNGIRLTASYERGLSKVNAGGNIQIYNQGIKIGAAMTF